MITFAIIGCGLIGKKRADAIASLDPHFMLVACVDIDISRAKELATHYKNCDAFSSYQEMLMTSHPDVVIISVIHNELASIALDCIRAEKHVFIEKPGAISSAQITELIKHSEKNDSFIRLGFNHRYHPAMQKAKTIVDSGELGKLMYVRGRYGHGGRLGYEKEWRANPALSGGGELIDQGMHLIDLSRWFLGEFSQSQGFSHTFFWDMAVEDNGFMLLKTDSNQVAFLHASWTEWKNTFSFEIYGERGKLHISGLGGSYGVENLAHYKMLPDMKPPHCESYEFPGDDLSFQLEIKAFIEDILTRRKPSPGLHDALAAFNIVEKIYSQSKGRAYA